MEWREIPEFPDYWVSEYGHVKRVKPDQKGRFEGLILKSTFDSDGYLKVNLFRGGKANPRTIHKIVCESFWGKKKNKTYQVGHRDGNKTNNHFSNLRWVTALENAADRDLHGRTSKGEKHPARTKPGYLPTGDNHWSRVNPDKVMKGSKHPESKLKENDIIDIRNSSFTGVFLSKKYGVSTSMICAIRKRRAWRHIE